MKSQKLTQILPSKNGRIIATPQKPYPSSLFCYYSDPKKYSEPLGLVGTWWSGQAHRVLSGIDGLLLVVVVGEGRLVVPVDFAIRRPDPEGPGAPCRDKLHWMQVMLDGRLAAFRRRGVALPPPMVVADSWFSDSKLMYQVATTHQGTFLVEGKSSYVFALPDGRQVKGHDLQQHREWPWRHSLQAPGKRYARLRATSPTYGAVTITIVDEAGVDQYYLMCLDTSISSPRLMRAWKRRSWIEYCFRTLKHLLATGACQVHSEAAYYGHLVLRLMGCLVLFYTSRVICKGRMTMEEILFSRTQRSEKPVFILVASLSFYTSVTSHSKTYIRLLICTPSA